MDRRALNRFWWALGLSLALVIFWTWGSRTLQRRRLERQSFAAYVQGPLSDLCYAFTRGSPESAAASLRSLEAMLPALPQGRLKEALAKLLPIHRQAAQHLSPQLLRQFIAEVTEMRDGMRHRIGFSDFLEVNAVLSSLKELNRNI